MSKYLCVHYINGSCKWGNACKKAHVDGLCKFFFCKGKCNLGDKCKFSHGNENTQGLEWNIIKQKKTKNTTSFVPNEYVVDMNLRFNESENIKSKDLIVNHNIFSDQKDLFNKIDNEIREFKNKDPNLFKSWHGDTHSIADDKKNWKEKCPTFNLVVNTLADHFNMDVKATQFNYFMNGQEWKPFHHDAAAVNKDKANSQNFTVGVSFGSTREIAFQYAGPDKNKVCPVLAFNSKDGDVYAFSKDINIFWKHGVRQDIKQLEPRISIILWGWVDMNEKEIKPLNMDKPLITPVGIPEVDEWGKM